MVKVEKQKGINQFGLRIIGLIATCVCSYGYVNGDSIYALAGWVAYPIFAYMLTDGFYHTIDRKKYGVRILVFAFISELFYDLLVFGGISMDGQNPLFTLLVGYLAIWVLEWVRNRYDNYFITLIAIVLLLKLGSMLCNILKLSFASFGVFFVVLFYIAANVSYPVLLEIVSIIYISFYWSKDVIATVTLFGIQYELCVQICALAALFFIHMYNGNRGKNSFKYKIAFYVVYPLQFLLFYLLSVLI